jgi:hypothetical protein
VPMLWLRPRRSHENAKPMETPSHLHGESLRRLLQGVAVGTIATIIIGFSWGGWVTGGSARGMTAATETKGEMSVPVLRHAVHGH